MGRRYGVQFRGLCCDASIEFAAAAHEPGIKITRCQPTAAARFSYSFAGRIQPVGRRTPPEALGPATGPDASQLQLGSRGLAGAVARTAIDIAYRNSVVKLRMSPLSTDMRLDISFGKIETPGAPQWQRLSGSASVAAPQWQASPRFRTPAAAPAACPSSRSGSSRPRRAPDRVPRSSRCKAPHRRARSAHRAISLPPRWSQARR
jgi:hypothetical protein